MVILATGMFLNFKANEKSLTVATVKNDINNKEYKYINMDIEKGEEEENIKTIEIMATGDILIHQSILDAQYDKAKDTYDFTNNFKHVRGYLEQGDVVIGNLETTLSGRDNFGYGGYPSFNTPDSLMDAMKESGFKTIVNMNNHALDRGEYGYKRTRKILIDKGFDVIGTREVVREKRYVIKDIGGIKIGLTAYGYTHVVPDGEVGLNGIEIPKELVPLMNIFHVENIENDFHEITEQINNMRSDGAEVIVFYMHWGDEYTLEPNKLQTKLAKFLADEKVDIIFGTHPHTLQPIDILNSSDGSKETVVVYSMGNFLSGQRKETTENSYTEDGVIVSVKVNKNLESNKIEVDKPTYIPTWINRYEKAGKTYYEVVPATDKNAAYLTTEGKKRIEESYNRTKAIIEKYNKSIRISN